MKRITKMKADDCYHTKNKKQEGQTKMKIFARIFLILLFVFALHVTLHTLNSYAAVPHLINYQGRLTDTAGVPLNGTYTLTFRIYDAETAGNLLWQGTYSVSIQKGIFAVLLGDINDAGYNFANLSFDKAYFLEIKVGAEVMSPRQRIASVGYAIRAENAENATQAQNANTVANVAVSTTPAANKILPLNEKGKLPRSILENVSLIPGENIEVSSDIESGVPWTGNGDDLRIIKEIRIGSYCEGQVKVTWEQNCGYPSPGVAQIKTRLYVNAVPVGSFHIYSSNSQQPFREETEIITVGPNDLIRLNGIAYAGNPNPINNGGTVKNFRIKVNERCGGSVVTQDHYTF